MEMSLQSRVPMMVPETTPSEPMNLRRIDMCCTDMDKLHNTEPYVNVLHAEEACEAIPVLVMSREQAAILQMVSREGNE